MQSFCRCSSQHTHRSPDNQAYSSKIYHLGFGKYALKITLVDANSKCDYCIFDKFA